MKLSFLQSIALAGLLGCCSGARADGASCSRATAKAAILPIRSAVVVKEVSGHVEYAYDSTGWKTLASGKTLRPGATIRASFGSTAILRVAESASFFKLSPSTAVHITNETPLEEVSTVSFAVLKNKRATTIAAD